ncbi:sensor domain-containing diguanylate cyclase [Synechococcus elongatus]|uniref:Diguanylate cyclase n=1 Tax=Synechococcus elongatus PCC 11801 TaxID=2219813 RepID=A0AAN1QPY6_SYNEL|nr:diguanylate cyclase [Synechococcus elongatus]AZB73239.1 histidine kinase [Synechococcus elongatus PCC 11801]
MLQCIPTRFEEQRLAALYRYSILDTPPEQYFDELTQLIAAICDVPIALISLVDSDRQWFKSKVGIEAESGPRSTSFCGHAIHQDSLFIVEDAQADPRFADNPFVTEEPYVRFYAGSPLVTDDQQILGTLCVIDRRPRHLTDLQQLALRTLSHQVIRELELRRALYLADHRWTLARFKRRLGNLVRSSLDLDQICQLAAQELGETLEIDHCSISLCTEAVALCSMSHYVRPEHIHHPIQWHLPDTLAEKALQQDQAIAFDQYPAEKAPAVQSPQSLLLVRTSVQDRANGLIALAHYSSRHAWTSDEIDLLESVAVQLGLAIEQAQLYRSVQAANLELHQLAYTDPLTQIPNRRAFDETFAELWQTALLHQQWLSLIVADIDLFKTVNDRFGYEQGDRCLKHVAQTLKTGIRQQQDFIARFGGEEFVVLLPNTDTDGAIAVVTKLQERLAQSDTTQLPVLPTLSFGIGSVIPQPQHTPEQLFRVANQAVRHVKDHGRNSFAARLLATPE